MEVERCYGCSLIFKGPSIYTNVHFTPFSAKHVEDIVAFLA